MYSKDTPDKLRKINFLKKITNQEIVKDDNKAHTIIGAI